MSFDNFLKLKTYQGTEILQDLYQTETGVKILLALCGVDFNEETNLK